MFSITSVSIFQEKTPNVRKSDHYWRRVVIITHHEVQVRKYWKQKHEKTTIVKMYWVRCLLDTRSHLCSKRLANIKIQRRGMGSRKNDTRRRLNAMHSCRSHCSEIRRGCGAEGGAALGIVTQRRPSWCFAVMAASSMCLGSWILRSSLLNWIFRNCLVVWTRNFCVL